MFKCLSGIRRELIDGILMPGKLADANFSYNVVLVSHLIDIISLSCQAGNIYFSMYFNICVYYNI